VRTSPATNLVGPVADLTPAEKEQSSAC